MEREDEQQQSASKKRRADVSSFSIAAALSSDDLSRAGTDTEGKVHVRSVQRLMRGGHQEI